MKRVREYLLLEIREINLLVNPFYFRSKQYFFRVGEWTMLTKILFVIITRFSRAKIFL